ncbi:MAG: DinB family protein, partial [Mycolicibacterium sp.]|nr:DinB family protein [Mycolicibacterium sp.]
MPDTTTLSSQLADQLEVHWTQQLRPRLDGLSDDE